MFHQVDATKAAKHAIAFILVCLYSAGEVASQVVINEIFYHAPNELDLEYVEILNAGDAEVDLSAWRIEGGILYEFPHGSKLRPNGFAVIAKQAELLTEFYDVRPIGEFEKSLSNRSDTVRLRDSRGQVVEEVVYQDRSPWPVSADGYSASLERVCATAPATELSNWEPSDTSSDFAKIPAGTPGRANSVKANALPPTIDRVAWSPKQPRPNTQLTVSARINATVPIERVVLHYRVSAPGRAGDEQEIEMTETDGGVFSATIATGKDNNRILGFWVVAEAKGGGVASNPRPNDLRPSHSVYVHDAIPIDNIPILQFFHIGKRDSEAGDDYVAQQRQGGYGGRGRYGGFGRGGNYGRYGRGEAARVALPPQGMSAVIYTDPSTRKSEIFDFVNVVRRKSGWKVRLHKDRPLLGMTTLNILYEPDEKTILNESLAYQLYSAAGNPSCRSGYLRLVINGQLAGYHLYFEQPNGNFFRRNEINNDGDLYKLIWMGNAEVSDRIAHDQLPNRWDVVGRHEKKSNRHDGYQDLIGLVETLEEAQSDDEMWRVIEEHFDLDNVVNYFAVNSLLSHWDGFFNNYFLYYDKQGTKKWSMYPWDQDSTWSQRGGRPRELHRMPLFFGAAGATPEGLRDRDSMREAGRARSRGRGRGFGAGGFGWWRDGGEVSRPLLANPQFYQRFLKRLDELTTTAFTPETFGKKIDSLRHAIEPEIRLRAKLRGQSESSALANFNDIMAGLHEHLVERRAFVRSKLLESGLQSVDSDASVR